MKITKTKAKRIVIAALSVFLALLSFSGCAAGKSPASTLQLTTPEGSQTSDTPVLPNVDPKEQKLTDYLLDKATYAMNSMIANYWTGSYENGYVINTEKNKIWRPGVFVLCLETMYKLTGDKKYSDMIVSQFNMWDRTFQDRWIYSAGNENNPILDDAAWTAMAMYTSYEMGAGDHALELAIQTVKEAYKFFSDNNISQGLYYSRAKSNNDYYNKSTYGAGLLYTALRICEAVQGTELEDKKLFNDSLLYYEWLENNLLRDERREYMRGGKKIYDEAEDMLYYARFRDAKETGDFYPVGYDRRDKYGFTSLFGNMGMAVIHKKLYDITGEEKYLERTLRTANAIASYYDYNGMLVNDYDPWTNCTFIGYFTSEVMPLEGVDDILGEIYYKTVASIMQNACFEGGYFSGNWNSGMDWDAQSYEPFSNPIYLMTSSNTTHLIYAAALANKLGCIDAKSVNLSFTEKEDQFHKIWDLWLDSPEELQWYKKTNEK